MNWLILRGLVREQRHWGDFRTTFERGLREKDPSAKVFALDFPGFGTEAARPSPASVAGIVEDLRARFLKLKAENPGEWSCFAISLGGMVALQWCATFADDFRKLVLVNSSVSDFSPLHKRMKPKNYPTVLKLLMRRDIYTREKAVLAMTTGLKGERLEMKAKRNAGFALPIRKIDALSQMLAAVRFKAPETLPLPLLVLVGAGDQLVDPSCSYEIARHYSGEVREHATANHDLPEDDPHWIAAQVSAWAYQRGNLSTD